MQITISKQGIQTGPFSKEQISQFLQSGEFEPNDLGWSPGMAEWKPLSAFPELDSLCQNIPAPTGPPQYISSEAKSALPSARHTSTARVENIKNEGIFYHGIIERPAVIASYLANGYNVDYDLDNTVRLRKPKKMKLWDKVGLAIGVLTLITGLGLVFIICAVLDYYFFTHDDVVTIYFT